jgi:drug/metabolite transporter (DMT)-like permease
MPRSTTINTHMSPGQWAMLLALSIVWGGSFLFQGIAVRELPTLSIVVIRVGLAAVILFGVMAAMGERVPRSGRVWAAFLAMGLLNNAIPFSLIVWGQTHIGSGLAAILNATTPIFTVIVAHIWTTDEKITPAKLIGIIAGLAGVTVMIGGDALQSLGINITAQLAVLGAALSYAMAGVFGRRFRSLGTSPLATATGQVTASTLLLAPLMLWVDQPWTLPMPSAQTIAALIALALLSTAFAYILYFRLLATAGATNLLLVTFLVPVSAVVLGIVVLNEQLLTKHLIGMALIGIGLAAISGRIKFGRENRSTHPTT